MLFLHFGKEKHGATGKAVPDDEEAHPQSQSYCLLCDFFTGTAVPKAPESPDNGGRPHEMTGSPCLCSFMPKALTDW